jgi:hypothetical protein
MPSKSVITFFESLNHLLLCTDIQREDMQLLTAIQTLLLPFHGQLLKKADTPVSLDPSET